MLVFASASTPFLAFASASLAGLLGLSLLLFRRRRRGGSADSSSGGASTTKRRRSSESASKKEEEPHEELDPERYPGGHLTVYYGSQTGTAESFAQILAREGESDRGFKVRAVDLEDAEDDLIRHLLDERRRDGGGRNRAVFLMATYGEGEPTDNAAAFVRLLRGKAGVKLPSDSVAMGEDFAEEKKGEGDDDGGDGVGADPTCLEGLDYAVFGLGNRQYEHFNAMGNFTDDALGKVGGRRVAALGVGDDDNDLEEDFENWKDNVLWPALEREYVGDKADKVEHHGDELPECPYVAEYIDATEDGKEVKPDEVSLGDVHTSTRHYFTSFDCPVTVCRELRTEKDPGSTVHVEIDISGADGLTYKTADNLGVLPVNDDAVVEATAQALGLDLDAVFRLKPSPGHEEKHSVLFPAPCTVRRCLSRYCDLTGSPRRSDLKRLAAYAKDPLDKSALMRMASKEGKEEYKDKVVGGHVGFVDVVSKLCPSISMTLEHFIGVCPRLLPRYYTISSSSSVHPDSIHLTVAVTQTTKRDGSMYMGVCSSHLANMKEGGIVSVFCRDSSFRLPADSARPVLLIGPGTGVAPMRALLQERSHQSLTLGLPVGANVLYFGCKRSDQDYIYRDELAKFKEDGVLNELRVAFSREGERKVYVQHLLAQNSAETYNLIHEEKASVYVCGGTKMGHDVSDALRSIVAEEGKMSMEEARSYLDGMEGEGRFVKELWSS